MIAPIVVAAMLVGATPAEPAVGFPERWDVQLDVVNRLYTHGWCAAAPTCLTGVLKPASGIGLAGQATWRLTSWGLTAGARQHVLFDYPIFNQALVLRFTSEAELGWASPRTYWWQGFGGLAAGVKWGVTGGSLSFQDGTVTDSYWGWAARPSVRLTAGARIFITPRVGIVAQFFYPLYANIPDLADGDSTFFSIGVTLI